MMQYGHKGPEARRPRRLFIGTSDCHNDTDTRRDHTSVDRSITTTTTITRSRRHTTAATTPPRTHTVGWCAGMDGGKQRRRRERLCGCGSLLSLPLSLPVGTHHQRGDHAALLSEGHTPPSVMPIDSPHGSASGGNENSTGGPLVRRLRGCLAGRRRRHGRSGASSP